MDENGTVEMKDEDCVRSALTLRILRDRRNLDPRETDGRVGCRGGSQEDPVGHRGDHIDWVPQWS